MAYDASWIPELDDTTPTNAEDITFGNEAIQEVKRVLNTSFPGAVENDSYDGTLGQLNSLVAGDTLPRDVIVMYAPENQSSEVEGPIGWTICDGRPRKTGGGTAPDLRSRFVVGAIPNISAPNPAGNPVGTTGGSANVTVTGQVTNGTALTTANLPQHGHGMFTSGTASGDSGTPNFLEQLSYFGDNVGANRSYKMQKSTGGSAVGATAPAGSNTAHTHAFRVDDTNGANVPPFYAALYIIKD